MRVFLAVAHLAVGGQVHRLPSEVHDKWRHGGAGDVQWHALLLDLAAVEDHHPVSQVPRLLLQCTIAAGSVLPCTRVNFATRSIFLSISKSAASHAASSEMRVQLHAETPPVGTGNIE